MDLLFVIENHNTALRVFYSLKHIIPFETLNFNIECFLPDLTARLSWINWENLGVHPGRRTLLTSLPLSGETSNTHKF